MGFRCNEKEPKCSRKTMRKPPFRTYPARPLDTMAAAENSVVQEVAISATGGWLPRLSVSCLTSRAACPPRKPHRSPLRARSALMFLKFPPACAGAGAPWAVCQARGIQEAVVSAGLVVEKSRWSRSVTPRRCPRIQPNPRAPPDGIRPHIAACTHCAPPSRFLDQWCSTEV